MIVNWIYAQLSCAYRIRSCVYIDVGGNFKKNKTDDNQVANSFDNSNTFDNSNNNIEKTFIQPNRLWKRNKYNLTLEEMEEINDFEDKYIKLFDSEEKKGENPWKTPEELANLTGTTVSNVSTVLKFKNSLVKNSKGQLNSKIIYEKNTPFWEKFLDTYTNKIK